MWRTVLAEAGVVAQAVDADRVRLSDGDLADTFLLRQFRRPLLPSQVPDRIDEPGLLVAPSASRRTVERASDKGWSVVTDSGILSLRIGNRTFNEFGRQGIKTQTPTRRGPVPWGTFALVRRLLAGPPTHQVNLAHQVGMSQSRVSRALTALVSEGLVERRAGGWRPCSWDGLLDWWLARYPGPGGTVGYWHSVDDVVSQAREALGVFADASIRVAVSGDVAADVLAPWQRPKRAILYAERGVMLGPAAFVPVASADEASLVLHVPRDPGVLLPIDWIKHGIPLTDPAQIIFDVTADDDSDAKEAADVLRVSLRERHAERWREAMIGGMGA